MKIVSLERRTEAGLGLRVTIETTDLDTHSKLGARRAAQVPALSTIAREALDKAEAEADALVREPRA